MQFYIWSHKKYVKLRLKC